MKVPKKGVCERALAYSWCSINAPPFPKLSRMFAKEVWVETFSFALETFVYEAAFWGQGSHRKKLAHGRGSGG